MYLPLLFCQPTSTLPAIPVLNPITPPEANPSYTVRWTAVARATSYLLERATSLSFGDATQVYADAATVHVETSTGIATHDYRVKARNAWGDSGWSNVQMVEVRWELGAERRLHGSQRASGLGQNLLWLSGDP